MGDAAYGFSGLTKSRDTNLLAGEEVFEGLVIFPAIAADITQIGGKDESISKFFGKNDQGSISQIHWQILVLLYQLLHSGKVVGLQLENSRSIPSQRTQKRLLRATSAAPSKKKGGLYDHWSFSCVFGAVRGNLGGGRYDVLMSLLCLLLCMHAYDLDN